MSTIERGPSSKVINPEPGLSRNLVKLRLRQDVDLMGKHIAALSGIAVELARRIKRLIHQPAHAAGEDLKDSLRQFLWVSFGRAVDNIGQALLIMHTKERCKLGE